MNTKRRQHACFVDEATSSIHVIGGYDGEVYNRLQSTEKWLFGTYSWQPSANFPEKIIGPRAVSANSNEYVGYMAGGTVRYRYTSKVWGLRREDMTWIEMSQKLKTGRLHHSLLNVPMDKVLGC